MQGHSYQQSVRLPYSKWSQHRADSGLIYLSHPVTGEVKWLWSRHHDPKTSNDYLVNTITNDRQWVTKQNEHLCPIKPQYGESRPSPASEPQGTSKLSNPKTNMPRAPAKTHVPTTKQSSKSSSTTYQEIAAPKSLGLTADEVLMLVADTGRRYIYNKKTKSSRWLPSRPPDTISSESKSRFGRSKNTKSSSSPFDDSDMAGAEGNHKGRDDSGKRPQKGQYSNGYSARRSAYSSDEAAMVIQRAFRANAVRKANVLEKLRFLTSVVDDVRRLTASGKYDMIYLRGLVNRTASREEHQDGAQRLLELGEYLTQQMLKVDAVESAGNQLVRAKRKLSVKMILDLTDEADALRKKLRR